MSLPVDAVKTLAELRHLTPVADLFETQLAVHGSDERLATLLEGAAAGILEGKRPLESYRSVKPVEQALSVYLSFANGSSTIVTADGVPLLYIAHLGNFGLFEPENRLLRWSRRLRGRPLSGSYVPSGDGWTLNAETVYDQQSRLFRRVWRFDVSNGSETQTF
jgi:hypothetical protein